MNYKYILPYDTIQFLIIKHIIFIKWLSILFQNDSLSKINFILSFVCIFIGLNLLINDMKSKLQISQ